VGFAAAAVGLWIQGAAFFEVLAHPAHGGHAVAKAGGDLGGALALVVELDDALADGHGNGFHAHSLPPRPPIRYIIYVNALVSR
jgi:hypothetical protein